MALVNGLAPYVHSNIGNFFSADAVNWGLSDGEGQTTYQISSMISSLEALNKLLKKATDDFLVGSSLAEIQGIFSSQDPFVWAAQRAIETKEMQTLLARRVAMIQRKQFENMPIKGILDNLVGDAEAVSVETMVEALSQAADGFFTIGYGGAKSQKKFLEDAFGTLDEKVSASLQRQLTSKKGKILELVEQQFSAEMEKAPISEVSRSVWDYFQRTFYEFLPKAPNPIRKQGEDPENPEDFLRLMKARFEARFEGELQKALTEKAGRSSASSIIQEKFLVDILQARKDQVLLQFDIKETGDLTAEELHKAEFFEGILKELDPARDQGKQSYTDFVIINKKTGKKARVQGKNYMGSLLKSEAEGMKVAKHHSFESSKLFEVLEGIKDLPGVTITDSEIADLAYLIANEAFFHAVGSRYHGSVQTSRGRQNVVYTSSNSPETASLSKAEDAVRAIIMKLAFYVLGVRFEEIQEKGEEDLRVASDMSNLFYLFGVTTLVPTYQIIENLILQFSKVERGLTELQFRAHVDKSAFSGVTPDSFWLDKAYAMIREKKRLVRGGPYADPTLLGVGQSMGANVTKNVKLTKINLQVIFEGIFAHDF